jgi:outer membrane cobalamin receptor
LALLLFTAINLKAQNDVNQSANLYNLDLEELGKIVVTASKTPQSVTKITQKVDANAVFAIIPSHAIEALQNKYRFYVSSQVIYFLIYNTD